MSFYVYLLVLALLVVGVSLRVTIVAYNRRVVACLRSMTYLKTSPIRGVVEESCVVGDTVTKFEVRKETCGKSGNSQGNRGSLKVSDWSITDVQQNVENKSTRARNAAITDVSSRFQNLGSAKVMLFHHI